MMNDVSAVIDTGYVERKETQPNLKEEKWRMFKEVLLEKSK